VLCSVGDLRFEAAGGERVSRSLELGAVGRPFEFEVGRSGVGESEGHDVAALMALARALL
jgi:hypothetical protein